MVTSADMATVGGSAKVLRNTIDAALCLTGAELLGHVDLLLRLHLDEFDKAWLMTTRTLKPV